MKVIALYLPQFHSFPENDLWWGVGFTEWTNTKKAKPQFRNHYQPHVPINNNYYNLLDDTVMPQQFDIAKKYGVDAFCYYHYWFANGKKLMEKPIEMMLSKKDWNMPFCLCWANENWSRRWDGSENEILIAQEYSDEKDWVNHFNYLLEYFNDSRYLKDENGKPILVIYKPELIDCLDSIISCWQKMALDAGFPGLCLICQYPQKNINIQEKFDRYIEFEPITTTSLPQISLNRAMKVSITYTIEVIVAKILTMLRIRKYKKYSYLNAIKASINRSLPQEAIPCVFTGWDNTARRGEKGIIYHRSTPKLFEMYCRSQIKKIKLQQSEGFLFINAWNEWAEGAHLEPDEKNKFQYLAALKSALDDAEDSN